MFVYHLRYTLTLSPCLLGKDLGLCQDFGQIKMLFCFLDLPKCLTLLEIHYRTGNRFMQFFKFFICSSSSSSEKNLPNSTQSKSSKIAKSASY